MLYAVRNAGQVRDQVDLAGSFPLQKEGVKAAGRHRENAGAALGGRLVPRSVCHVSRDWSVLTGRSAPEWAAWVAGRLLSRLHWRRPSRVVPRVVPRPYALEFCDVRLPTQKGASRTVRRRTAVFSWLRGAGSVSASNADAQRGAGLFFWSDCCSFIA